MSKHKVKRQQAKALFANSQLDGKEIAEFVEVSEQTISKWRKEDKWDEARLMKSTEPGTILTFLFNQINKLKEGANDRMLDSKEVDSLLKLSKAIQEIRGGQSPQTIMEVLNNFLLFLQDKNQPLAKELAPYTLEYIDYVKQVKL